MKLLKLDCADSNTQTSLQDSEREQSGLDNKHQTFVVSSRSVRHVLTVIFTSKSTAHFSLFTKHYTSSTTRDGKNKAVRVRVTVITPK